MSSRVRCPSRSSYLAQEDVSPQWETWKTVVLRKKDNLEDLRHYRPIVPYRAVYTLFTKVLVDKMTR